MSDLKLRKALWLINKVAPYVTMDDLKAYVEELKLDDESGDELTASDIKDIIFDLVKEI